MWVRNFRKNAPPIDINNLITHQECDVILSNEIANQRKRFPDVDSENIIKRKVLIVSDGYDFLNKQKILSKLPQDVCVIAVNKALAKWTLVGDDCPENEKRSIAFYVINNPYSEASSFLPRRTRYYPRCIASTRTHSDFIADYRSKGIVYGYSPVSEKLYSGPSFNYVYKIDDYRNPIVAAIGLAHRFEVEKLALFCCDDSFKEQRPGAVQLENELWTYPQHIVSSNIIDASLFWLSKGEVTIGNCSMGPKLQNATYINPESIIQFFEDNNG